MFSAADLACGGRSGSSASLGGSLYLRTSDSAYRRFSRYHAMTRVHTCSKRMTVSERHQCSQQPYSLYEQSLSRVNGEPCAEPTWLPGKAFSAFSVSWTIVSSWSEL